MNRWQARVNKLYRNYGFPCRTPAKGATIVMVPRLQLMLDYSDRAVVVMDGQVLADLIPASS